MMSLNKFMDGLNKTVCNYRRFCSNRPKQVLDGLGKTVQNLLLFFNYNNYNFFFGPSKISFRHH
jgi:hypothetical protein